MKTKQLDYGARSPYPAQSNCYFNSLSIFDLSIHRSSHQEHPAH